MNRKTILFKINIWMLLLTLFLSGNVHATPGRGLSEVESVNPEYEYYLKHKEEFKYGYVPARAEFVLSGRTDATAEALPSSYDSRSRQLISPVKNQGETGTCWAHAASSSVETAWKRQNGSFEDLSEMHLAYHAAPDTDLDSGGNSLLAIGYYSRMDGPIDESEYSTVQDVAVVNGSRILRGRSKMEDYGKKRGRMHVGEMIAISKSEIKKYVKDYGAVMSSYHATADSSGYYTHDDAYLQKELGYHYPDGATTNHAISIVGWDDNRTVKNRKGQQAKGAFLVKNSWGTDFGDGGYFWITYNSFPDDQNSYVFSEAGSPKDRIYHTEAYGWEGHSLVFHDNTPLYVVNEYRRQSTSAEETVEVAIYKRSDERVRYTFWVGEPKNSSGDWKDYDYRELGQQVIEHGGYFTIPTRPVTLTADRFVLKMKIEPLDGSKTMFCTSGNSVSNTGFVKSAYSFEGRYYSSIQTPATLSLITDEVNTPILRDVQGLTVDPIPVQKYTGEAIRPTVTVKDGAETLKERVDYDLQYENNVQPGRGTVILTGKGRYTGTLRISFEIQKPEEPKKSIRDAIADPIPVQEYTGRSIRPRVTVRDGAAILTEHVDYVLSYKNNVEPGQAMVVLTGLGEYTGTKEVSFEIISPEVFSEYKKWNEQYDIPEDKEWTIQFSRTIDPLSFNETKVYIVHEDFLDIPIAVRLRLSKDGTKLIVSPMDRYLRGGRYHLFIRDLYTSDGRRLKDNIRMTFTVRN